MRVLVVDDEPAMLLAMKRLLKNVEGVELVGNFRSAQEALEFVRNEEADLVFLDIQIAEDNGLELARSLRAARADLDIVFTTSHAEYAIDAYDVYPLDFMVKPISRTRLVQTIARAAAGGRTLPGDSGGSGNSGSSVSFASSGNAGAAASPPLTVRGLGCFEVGSKQAGTVKWISRKSMELFAYLLMHRGRSVSRLRILEDIFPEMPHKNAELYLNTAVYQLRKALSLHGAKEIVVSAQEQYRIDLNHADVDFIRLETDMAELAEINQGNAAAAIELERRFAGELFEDKPFEWAAMERERLSLLYDSVAKRLAGWLLKERRYSEALVVARRLVSRNEFEEESNLLLLRTLGDMGDRQALSHYYEHYTQLLLRELGLAPSPECARLYEQYL